jgi:hypothetical protein
LFLFETVAGKGTDTQQREVRSRRIGNMEANETINRDGRLQRRRGVDMEKRCTEFFYIMNGLTNSSGNPCQFINAARQQNIYEWELQHKGEGGALGY